MSGIFVPGVTHRQLPGKSRTLLDPRWITVHTMVWDLDNCERYFARPGNPYSHFGTGYDGEIRQWQDLLYRAASCYKANPYSISIENADRGTGFPNWGGSDVPYFTDEQADSLVVLLSWLCHRFSLPKVAINTSCPHERGVGYHRLGVNPWRNTKCGLLMSSSAGKVCPGDKRIAQLKYEIIPAVSAPIILPPNKAVITEEEDEMQFPAHIVKSPDGAAWWVTDGITRQWIKNREHAAVLIGTGRVKAEAGTGDMTKLAEIKPWVWPQSVIDSIRPVGDMPPG